MAARPAVGPVTGEVYEGLPEVYRDADAGQADGPSNYPLLRYLSTLLDQLTAIAALADRFTYVAMDERDVLDGNAFGVGFPWQRFGTGELGDDTYGQGDTADLVDPNTADAGWLPWLAQLLGVTLPPGSTIAEQRATMANPTDAWAHGTRQAIAREARRELGGDAYVAVIPHINGDPFAIGIVTKQAETYGTTSFAELKALAPTWRDLKALGSYGNAEAAAPMLAASVERPAGYRLVHVYLD